MNWQWFPLFLIVMTVPCTHSAGWWFSKQLVSKGFVSASESTHQPPMDSGAKKSFTSQLQLWHYKEWIQISFFWHKVIPPQRGDVLIRQASIFLVNDEQFVLQLTRLYWKTFEENVWKNNRLEKVNTLNSTWKLSSWQIVFLSCDEMTQKAFWRQRVLCLITFPQMPKGNAQICILSSQSWCDFFFVLQKMPLHNSGAFIRSPLRGF